MLRNALPARLMSLGFAHFFTNDKSRRDVSVLPMDGQSTQAMVGVEIRRLYDKRSNPTLERVPAQSVFPDWARRRMS
jgi:hypothetical protein